MECLSPAPSICRLSFPEGDSIDAAIPDCNEDCTGAALSRDGTKIAYFKATSDGAGIWQFALGNQQSQVVMQNEDPKISLGWTPDGESMTYVVLRDIRVLSEDEVEAIAKNPNAPSEPVPIYHHSTLHIYNLANGNEIQLTSSKGNVLAYDWSPSGDQIVISARLEDLNQDGAIDFDDPARLYIITLSDQTLEPFVPLGISRVQMLEPSWSFDGQYIAYVTDGGDLVIISTATGSEIVRFGISAGRAYRWAPDTLRIAYIGYTHPDDAVVSYTDLYMFDLATGTSKRLTDTSSRTVFGCWERNGINLDNLAWSPDGKYVALIWRTEGKKHLVVSRVDDAQLTWVIELEQYYRLIAWGR